MCTPTHPACAHQERVVGNFHVCDYKERQVKKEAFKAAKAAGDSNGIQLAAPPGIALESVDSACFEDGPYDTEEHHSASLFMGKTLSRKDLQELAKSKDE